MAMFILDDATGIGSDDVDTLQAFIDLVIIANDDGVGMDDPVSGLQRVTYTRTQNGVPQVRLDDLVNGNFTPDYGSGPQAVDIVVIPALSGFTLDDGTSFTNNGTALPPMGSGLAGSTLNTTPNCLVIYDTQQNICTARDGTGGEITLPISNPVVLYHEFSHAFRIVNNTLLALTGTCDPSSPEENAAITEENDLRTQIANRQGVTPELRDPGIHCGQVGCDSGCCIIATAASGSLSSLQVQQLRRVRDHFVRSTEVGFAFFQQFFRDYYAFSPQVCTMLVGKANVLRHLLEGYIEPLLDFWKLVIERSIQRYDETGLGVAFARRHSEPLRSLQRLQALERTLSHWLGQETHPDVPPALLELLRERAWPSEYVQWALISPVRIYHKALTRHVEGAGELSVGRELSAELEAWTPDLPISDVWGVLAADEVGRELEFCDRVLFQSNGARRRFEVRLVERYPDVSAVRAALDKVRFAMEAGHG
jgi:hypothetical protein